MHDNLCELYIHYAKIYFFTKYYIESSGVNKNFDEYCNSYISQYYNVQHGIHKITNIITNSCMNAFFLSLNLGITKEDDDKKYEVSM